MPQKPQKADQVLEAAVEAFLSEYPYDYFSTPEAAKGRCDGVARDLYVSLRERGLHAEIINGTGLKIGLPDDAHPEWLDFRGKEHCLWHAAVRSGEWVIDLTGIQYGQAFSRRFLPYSTFEAEWSEVGTGPYWGCDPPEEAPAAEANKKGRRA